MNCLLTTLVRKGMPRVPQKLERDGLRLGSWVTTQRHTFKQGKLDADRQHRLEQLSGWTWEAKQSQWDDNYQRLQQFIEREGHAATSRSHSEDHLPLGQWVHNQRRSFALNTLEPAKIRKLEALSQWEWRLRP